MKIIVEVLLDNGTSIRIALSIGILIGIITYTDINTAAAITIGVSN